MIKSGGYIIAVQQGRIVTRRMMPLLHRFGREHQGCGDGRQSRLIVEFRQFFARMGRARLKSRQGGVRRVCFWVRHRLGSPPARRKLQRPQVRLAQ